MQKLATIKLERVQYIPKTLEPGLLYVAEKYHAAVHLCACGCGTKLSTPLRPTEWTLEIGPDGPTLSPSVGNWQFPCQSHYFIRNGTIVWSGAWSPERIKAGRDTEERRRRAHYEELNRSRAKIGLLGRVWKWIKSLFR